MRRWINLAAVLLVLVLAAATFAQEAGKDTDERIAIKTKYLRVEPVEIADHPDNFIGKSVEIRDRFSRLARLDDIPSAVTRIGLHPRTHTAFLTHPVTGSGTLCFISNQDTESLKVLEGLVEESPVTILGDVLARTRGKTIIAVGRMFRGHVDPPTLEKRRLVVTFQQPDGKPVQYTIPELNKLFTISVPTVEGKTVKVHFKAELR